MTTPRIIRNHHAQRVPPVMGGKASFEGAFWGSFFQRASESGSGGNGSVGIIDFSDYSNVLGNRLIHPNPETGCAR
jgi:hypothetical protein